MPEPVSRRTAGKAGARHQPYQVQAFRLGEWRVISGHYNEDRAKRGLASIARCTPGMPDFYRIRHEDDPEWIPMFRD